MEFYQLILHLWQKNNQQDLIQKITIIVYVYEQLEDDKVWSVK